MPKITQGLKLRLEAKIKESGKIHRILIGAQCYSVDLINGQLSFVALDE